MLPVMLQHSIQEIGRGSRSCSNKLPIYYLAVPGRQTLAHWDRTTGWYWRLQNATCHDRLHWSCQCVPAFVKECEREAAPTRNGFIGVYRCRLKVLRVGALGSAICPSSPTDCPMKLEYPLPVDEKNGPKLPKKTRIGGAGDDWFPNLGGHVLHNGGGKESTNSKTIGLTESKAWRSRKSITGNSTWMTWFSHPQLFSRMSLLDGAMAGRLRRIQTRSSVPSTMNPCKTKLHKWSTSVWILLEEDYSCQSVELAVSREVSIHRHWDAQRKNFESALGCRIRTSTTVAGRQGGSRWCACRLS